MYELTIDGRPQPKQRPRVTKSHTYTPKETVQQENKIIAQWVAKHGNVEIEGDIELICQFWYSDKRTADLDNLIKLVSDGLGGGGEGYRSFNDRQIKKLHGYISTSAEEDEERTLIVIREIE